MKRFLDVLFSLLLLILCLPVFLIISLVIFIDDGCPVFFRQIRVGKNNKLFKIYKFRTMVKNAKNCPTNDIHLDKYRLRTGKILRMTSLDELPQIINILIGDMSFVGPRPLIPDEKEIRKLREANNIYSVLPGITGLAQVNGRDIIGPEEKVRYDSEYVKNHSISMDAKIMLKTFVQVLRKKDITDADF